MKIDILLAVGWTGGVENTVNMVGKYLVSQGHEIRVIQCMYEGEPWVDSSIPFHYLFWGLQEHQLDDFSNSYLQFLQESYIPEIILATAVPYMCNVARIVAQQLDSMPIIISWLHGPLSRYIAAGYGGLDALQYADYHFAISPSIAKEISGLPNAKIVPVNNAVDLTSSFNVKARAKNFSHSLSFIGRITPEKRLDLILQSLSLSHSKWHLNIVGSSDDDLESELKGYAKELKISSQISWFGWRERPWKVIKDTDFLILASEYEGFPLVAIEAQANGIPVISTPVSGIVGFINPGENGYLFPNGDAQFLADILDNLDKGYLPLPNADICKEKAKPFLAENALPEFERYLMNIYV